MTTNGLQPLDLTGQKFGRLTVIRRAENNKQQRTRQLCRCSCGVIKTVDTRNLRSGAIVSCGCYRKEKILDVVKQLAKDKREAAKSGAQ